MVALWKWLFGRKVAKPEPNFSPRFPFEWGDVRLNDGGLFTPAKDAAERWMGTELFGLASFQRDFRILYLLHDGRFVELSYRCCHSRQLTGREYWISDTPPDGGVVAPSRAQEFLLRYQYELPPQLRSAVTLEPFDATRGEPIPTLADGYSPARRRARRTRTVAIQAVDFHKTIDEIVFWGIRFVQYLRDPPQVWEARSSSVCWEFYATLTAVHPVDLQVWPVELGVPPATIRLLDWTWPFEYEQIEQLLKQLLEICEPELGCVSKVSTELRTSSRAPSDHELDEARNTLIARLPEIERIISEVRRQFLVTGDTDSPTVDPGIEPPAPNETSLKVSQIPGVSPLKLATGLTEAVDAAYRSYKHAEERLIASGAKRVRDQDAYEWLKTHGFEEYVLPEQSTWERQVRSARRELKDQKNLPRVGRSGGSVRKADEV